MGYITEIFDGICKLVRLPFEIVIEVEKNVGTKAIIAIMMVGTWCLSQIIQLGVSEQFGWLAASAAGVYLGYSAYKAGVASGKNGQ